MATDIAPQKIENITARLFNASICLEKSSDFVVQITQIITILREQISPFVQLSYYQLDNYPDSICHYFPHPLPIGREKITLDEDLAEVQVWRQGQRYISHETEELPMRWALTMGAPSYQLPPRYFRYIPKTLNPLQRQH